MCFGFHFDFASTMLICVYAVICFLCESCAHLISQSSQYAGLLPAQLESQQYLQSELTVFYWACVCSRVLTAFVLQMDFSYRTKPERSFFFFFLKHISEHNTTSRTPSQKYGSLWDGSM